MKSKLPTDEYLEQARQLSPEDTERLIARMRSQFTRQLRHRTLSAQQAIALQLKYEDEGLAQWRERMTDLRRQLDAEAYGSPRTAKVEPKSQSITHAKPRIEEDHTHAA